MTVDVSEAAARAAPPRLELRGISKRFGGVRALVDANLVVSAGEVHGLLGENGSGKSTLIKILAGYHMPDAGEVSVNGSSEPLPPSAKRLQELGVSFVHQDLGLLESVSVTENLLLREIATRRGLFFSWRKAHRRSTEMLARYGLSIRGSSPLSDLTAFERAMVAIVRALEGIRAARSVAQGLLVLDEAMAFLADHERALLASAVRELAREGVSVVLVSHDLDDALGVCDRVTVLRDGRVAGTVPAATTKRAQLVELILGRCHLEAPSQLPSGASRTTARIRLKRFGGAGVVPLDLELAHGELLGVTGLVGESFARIPYLIFGALQGVQGTLELSGRSYDLRRMTPARALHAGIVLIPGDRQRQGAIASLSTGENVAIPRLRAFFRGGRLRNRALQSAVHDLLERFDVRPPDPAAMMSTLSGGNQQKAIVAKWLQLQPNLLLLDEPTVGVDVGSRAQIFGQIRGLAASGAAVVCASSDYAQLAELCDRVLIFSGGQLRGQLSGDELTRENILSRCLLLGDGASVRAQLVSTELV